MSNLNEKLKESQFRIIKSGMDFTIHNLKNILGDKDYLNLQPIYQRRNVWDRNRKSKLIESFLMNIPVPPIFLYETEYNKYEVMDGRQRLTAIFDYLDNKYGLTGLEYWKEINGLRYADLENPIQRALLRGTISAVVLMAETEDVNRLLFDDVKMILFRRLNTGGVRLNAQELRNALYPGIFNDMLICISQTDNFKLAWDIPVKENYPDGGYKEKLAKNALYRKMGDCELVLRYFGVLETHRGRFKGSMRSILDSTMKYYSKMDKYELTEYKEETLEILQKYANEFEGKPFANPITGRPSKPLYDAMMVAGKLTKLRGNFKQKVISIRQRLQKDKEFYSIITGKGNSTEAIKERVLIVMEMMS